MYCQECGNQIEENTNFCKYCGKAVNANGVEISQTNVNYNTNALRARHGFTTFWLWFGIITCTITGITSFIMGIDAGDSFSIITAFVIIFQVVCYSMMIKWRKQGFYLMIIAAIIGAIVNMVNYNVGVNNKIVQIFITPISIVILYLILKLRKDGKSTWEQLA